MRRTAARTGAALLILFGGLAVLHVAAAASVKVTIGSKAFTESVILGEMLGLLAREAGAAAEHRRQLGGTRVLWNALLGGEIDAYPEYTGTLMQETLAGETLGSHAELERALAARGLRMSQTLGFNNTYAIGVRKELAERLGLRSISDLKDHPGLVLGFGNEFMDRADGWPGLQRHYDLPHRNVRGLDHDLAYRGIAAGSLQVTDLYTTDAEIAYYQLRALDDDLNYFPVYNAVIVYRAELERRTPEVVALFERLAGRIDAATMSALNARVKLDGESESAVAADFLAGTFGWQLSHREQTPWQRLWTNSLDHLLLVGISLSSAILLSIPLGVLAARRPRLGQVVLGAAGILQTIPSLALFVFMIPLPYTILRISGISVPAFLAPPPVWPFTAGQRIEFVARDDVVERVVVLGRQVVAEAVDRHLARDLAGEVALLVVEEQVRPEDREELGLGHAAVHLHRPDRGHEHHAVGREARLAALDVHELLGAQVGPEACFRHHVVCELQRGGEAVGEPRLQPLAHHDPVHHHVDVMAEFLVQRGRVVQFVKLPVDFHPLKALLAQFQKFLAVLSLAVADDRREQVGTRPLFHAHHPVDHVLHLLRLDGQAGGR